MSARAAWRLVDAGFTDVADYVDGLADWLAAGFPVEGTAGPAAAALMRPHVPACAPGDAARVALARMDEHGTAWCAVVDRRGILLGRVERAAAAAAPGRPARDLADPAPKTVRPGATSLPHWLARLPDALLVTRSDGTLLGMLDPALLEPDR